MKKARFKIGQEFLLPQKHRREAVISDILTTTNASGVVVDVRDVGAGPLRADGAVDADGAREGGGGGEEGGGRGDDGGLHGNDAPR